MFGSGVRNLFKYSKFYSGQEPKFIEGDVFRIIVPLDDEYSFDYDIIDNNRLVRENGKTHKMPISADKMPINNLSAQQRKIFEFV